MNNWLPVIGVSLSVMGGILIGVVFVGLPETNALWQKELIARGLGQYCPVDGHWAFVGECAK